jgi:hypothetical protein
VDDFEGLLVGEAAAFDKARFDAQPSEPLGDLRPAAVDEDRIDAQAF